MQIRPFFAAQQGLLLQMNQPSQPSAVGPAPQDGTCCPHFMHSCCRELLEGSGLIECHAASRSGGQQWRLPAHQAAAADAAVAALLGGAPLGGAAAAAGEDGAEQESRGQGDGGMAAASTDEEEVQPQAAPAGAAGAAWHIAISPEQQAELRRRSMDSPQYLHRIQRCAASILHTLLPVRVRRSGRGGEACPGLELVQRAAEVE